MNKLCALLLVVAVPAFAQQKVALEPREPAPSAAEDALKHEQLPMEPLIAAGAIVVVAAVVISVVLMAMPRSTPVQASDFACNRGGSMCDGFVNPPMQ